MAKKEVLVAYVVVPKLALIPPLASTKKAVVVPPADETTWKRLRLESVEVAEMVRTD